MAARKPTRQPGRPARKPAVGTSSTKASGSAAQRAVAGQPGRPRKPGKSIVNQKQAPWGLIVTVTLLVLFAGGIITYAITRSGSSSSTPYLNELAAAKQIRGVTFRAEPDRNHVTGVVKYNASPPVGGNHAPVWADCTGTVYSTPIAAANAMHSLEHGAVWITYRPGLPQTQVAEIARLVTGQNYTFMSPYLGLKTPISVQSWGYQLPVNSAADPRLAQFIGTLRTNPKTTPEPGASCANPTFTTNPSGPGQPSKG